MINDLSGKKLLVLGGTRISCEIIEKAKELGVTVLVTDYNSVDDSPGKQIADEFFMVSATDVGKVVDLIRQEHVDGVLVGFNDMLLPYYADICNKAGLPCYGTKEQFELFTNKNLYKAKCKEYSIPTIEEYSINIDTFEEDVLKVTFPVLIKPADNSGARGIFIAKNKEELLKFYKKALKFTKTGKILVEHYLTGEEVTIFFVFQDGKYYLTGIGNRHVKSIKDGIIPLPVGYTFPSSITPDYMKHIFPSVKSMLSSLDIKNGMMFMQCKVENGVAVVYDIGFRLTASLEYRIFDVCCGYNPMEMMIRFALTGKMAVSDIGEKINPALGAYAYNISFLAEPGHIDRIVGIDKIRGIEGVAGIVVAHYPGETISAEMEGLLSQITVRIVGKADSKLDLWKKINFIQNSLQILSDEGQNMVLRKINKFDYDNLLMRV